MTSTPRLLGDNDPLDSLRPLVHRYEFTAAAARRRYLDGIRFEQHGRDGDGRSPLLVIAASGIDAFRADRPAWQDVDLLGDSELGVAAERAGLTWFDLNEADASQVRGALTALRGAVGEQWVLDRLRDRTLPVPDGAIAVELLPFTAPGVDLLFTNRTGAEVAAANVKVAASSDVVMSHFGRYPDIGIVYATSDAAVDAADRGIHVVSAGDAFPSRTPVVIDIGRTAADFDHHIGNALTDDGAALTDGPAAVDLVPWASTAAIGVRALLRLRAGISARDVVQHASRDVFAAGTASTAANLASRLTSSEPSVALVAMISSALTFAALDTRRAWTTLADQLAIVTASAERITTDTSASASR